MTQVLDHQLLNKAIEALHTRTYFSAFPENPNPEVYGQTADAEGKARFEGLLNQPFAALQQRAEEWVGQEESPYTGQRLGITYPYLHPDALVEEAQVAYHIWRKIPAKQRAGLLLESLEGMRTRFYDIAYATMHTSGQSYTMSFQASGPHAADRALEALAAGYEELTRFPAEAIWEKPMGKYNLALRKTWRAVPKGVSLAIGCATFPTWNTLPGLFASLVTGNPVIVKPHPKAVLPIALVVAEIQKVLVKHQLPPTICQLAPDADNHLIAKDLAEHPLVKLIDFTGSAKFGEYIESLKGKTTFTEKTGVNPILLDSVEDLDKVVQNLAFSVTLYSGQMCTAPQNFFIPEAGVKTPAGTVPYPEVVQKLSAAIRALLNNPKAGPHIVGTIQNPDTLQRITDLRSQGLREIGEVCTVQNAQFPEARICTPVLLEADATDTDVFGQELFGPVALVIKTENTEHSLELASRLAREQGAISCGAYTTDTALKDQIADEMSLAATPVSFNLTGGIFVNQHAAFSDFHVTGGNPAGNASFTNPEFVVKRFTWVGFREPLAS